jgi:hypothetical protein
MYADSQVSCQSGFAAKCLNGKTDKSVANLDCAFSGTGSPKFETRS